MIDDCIGESNPSLRVFVPKANMTSEKAKASVRMKINHDFSYLIKEPTSLMLSRLHRAKIQQLP
jgi:hypothetical protein